MGEFTFSLHLMVGFTFPAHNSTFMCLLCFKALMGITSNWSIATLLAIQDWDLTLIMGQPLQWVC